MKIDLSNKLALITGASGELGRTMVRTLANCGADIVIHYHQNKTQAEHLKTEVEHMGQKAMIVQADITKEKDIIKMQQMVNDTLGAPQIIVNNAVIQYQWTNILEQPLEDYESQFQSCVLHNVLMIKAFVPDMIKQNYGRVIGINTECAIQSFPTQSAYVAGKRGMDGIYRVLAREVGKHNITANQVAPGWTKSEKDYNEETKEQQGYAQNVPLKRRGTDQEIANVVAFLASDLASFITGAYIPVSGGNVIPAI